MMNQCTRSILTLCLIAGLTAASVGCGEATGEGPLESTSQELVVLSLMPEAPNSSAVNFGYSENLGWHFTQSDAIQPINFHGAESLSVRHQSLGAGSGFSSSMSGSSGFRANIASAGGFSAASSGSGGFFASAGGAAGFSAGLSAGPVFCSLDILCVFVDLLCQAFGGGAECAAAVSQCYAEIGELMAQLPASMQANFCAAFDGADFFGGGGGGHGDWDDDDDDDWDWEF